MMPRSFGRRVIAGVALVTLLLAFPATAAATITGGCTGEGHSTSSSANLTADSEWHLKRDDVAGGSGTAPSPMKAATVSAYGLGLAIPIAAGTSEDGDTAGSVEGVSVSAYATLGQRFVVAGSATGDGTPCSGRIEIIIDDVNPVLSVLGGGGILLAVLGLLGVLSMMRGRSSLSRRIVSALVGAVGGLGAALALEQFRVLDPTQLIGLFIVIGAAVIGFVTAGMFSGRPETPMAGAGAGPA
jgi:hypothetical protein